MKQLAEFWSSVSLSSIEQYFSLPLTEEFVNTLSELTDTELIRKYLPTLLIILSNHPYPEWLTPALQEQLLTLKNQWLKSAPPLSAPIHEHAIYYYHHFLAKPFKVETDERPRFYHGMLHASRVSIFIVIFAQLYRLMNEKEALQLDEEEIKLLQLTALLHDAGRGDDGIDFWDKESAILVLNTLSVLNVPFEKAKLFAEAVANKDDHENYKAIQLRDGEIYWENLGTCPKNIYQKLIHDADCLDIIRARSQFHAEYLDFYKSYIKKTKNEAYLQVFSHLLTEAKSLIERQGDTFQYNQLEQKDRYENYFGFHYAIEDIAKLPEESLLKKLYFAKFNEPIDFSMLLPKLDGIDKASMQSLMERNLLYVRSIVTPSAVYAKENAYLTSFKLIETLAHVELRKMARRPGIPTLTQKPDRFLKNGNPHRSISLIGNGGGVFAASGFIIIDPPLEHMDKISLVNAGTGVGKKKDSIDRVLSITEKKQELDLLKKKLAVGGGSLMMCDFPATHVEILYHLDHVDAIYFTQDRNIGNIYTHGFPDPYHPVAPFLQAYYLQQAYFRKFKKTLALFEYSGIHNSIQRIGENELTQKNILNKWQAACLNYINQQSLESLMNLFNNDVTQQIKTRAIYGDQGSNFFCDRYGPLDESYPRDLKQQLNSMIYQILESVLIVKLKNIQSSSLAIWLAYLYDHEEYFKRHLKIYKTLVHSYVDLKELLMQMTSDRLTFLLRMDLAWVYRQLASRDEILAICELVPLEHRFNLLFESPFLSKKEWLQIYLKQAVLRSNLVALEHFISQGADLNYRYQYGFKLLHFAVQQGNMEIIQALINHGTEIGVNNQFNENALHLSVYRGDPALVKFFLEQGLDPNQMNDFKKSPLDAAIELGFPDILKLLEQYGAINWCCESVRAIKLFERYMGERDIDALSSLLNNFMPTRQEVFSCLRNLEFSDSQDLMVINLLVSKYHKLFFNTSAANQFILKALKQQPSSLDLFVKHGYNLASSHGQQLLHLAAQHQDFQLLRHLIKEGISVDETLISGFMNQTNATLSISECLMLPQLFRQHVYLFLEQKRYDKIIFFFSKLNNLENIITNYSLLSKETIESTISFINNILLDPFNHPWLTTAKQLALFDFLDHLEQAKRLFNSKLSI